jgi:hypothetical protein
MDTAAPEFADVDRLQRMIGGDDPLLSLAQVSRRLDVPLSTLSDAVRRKRIPALVMPDARRYVRLSAARAYLNRPGRGRRRGVRADDALLAIAALSEDAKLRSAMPKDFATQLDRAFDLYASRLDKDWGLTDCISFVVMRDRKTTRALTTDEHFAQASFEVIL